MSVYPLLSGPRSERIKLEATRSCKIRFERTESCSHRRTRFMIELYKIRFDQMRFHFKNSLWELQFPVSIDPHAFWVKRTAKSRLHHTWLMEVNPFLIIPWLGSSKKHSNHPENYDWFRFANEAWENLCQTNPRRLKIQIYHELSQLMLSRVSKDTGNIISSQSHGLS